MKQPIILIGGGGHCISVIDVIEQTKLYEIIGILDLPEKVGQNILGYPIIGTDQQIEKFTKDCSNFVITVGQIKSSDIRQTIYKKVKKTGAKLPVITSPTAHISKHSIIDEGTIIMHGVLVNAKAKIGKCCIINSQALIEHEAEIGEFCHISTGAKINGQVVVGKQCLIGSNTTVVNNIRISSKVLISAGSNVLKNIEQSGVYIGYPLRKIR